MTEEKILQATADYVKERLEGEGSGHDWWHIVRVRKLAYKLSIAEGADPFICQMAALLHDLVDEKLVESEEEGLRTVETFLTKQGLSQQQIASLVAIITAISYKGGSHMQAPLSLEGQVVQDADRLDAIGAIGIARTMAYSGNKNRIIHDPDFAIREQMSLEEYRSNQGTAIAHFYEKLLKLKDLMNTARAKDLAEDRHAFMQAYLQQFYAEWEGDC